MGFRCLSEYQSSWCYGAYWLNAAPLCRYPLPGPGFGVFATTTCDHPVKDGNASSRRLSRPFRVSPCVSVTHSVRSPWWVTPFEVSALERFPSRQEPLNSQVLPTLRLCCVLRVSHSLDALLSQGPAGLISSRSRSWGFSLSRLFLLCVPYDLSIAAALLTLALLRSPNAEASGPARRRRLQGLLHHKSRLGGPRISRDHPNWPS